MTPALYIAAMGRSGSTALANWLTRPQDRQAVFIEPEFLARRMTEKLPAQFAALGLPAPASSPPPRDAASLRDWMEEALPASLKGWKWGFKEVLGELHERCLTELQPGFILVTVRDIRDIFLSFVEKHRLQNNEDRFPVSWSFDYCLGESARMTDFAARLEREGRPHMVVRYEDFVASERLRGEIEQATGWRGGGDTSRHLALYGREFEARRHPAGVSARSTSAAERRLPRGARRAAEELAGRCQPYMRRFGYV